MSKSTSVNRRSKKRSHHLSKTKHLTKFNTSNYSTSAAGVMQRNALGMPFAAMQTGIGVRPQGSQTRSRSHTSLGSRIISHLKQFALTKEDETLYYAPKTWAFWRGIILYFFIFSVVGHWLEIPYCLSMHSLFGIVEADYAMWADPLYVPYWVYGVGAAVITLFLMPLKIRLVGKRKTMWGAALEFFAIAVVMCAALECIMGWIINQPDQFGEYPYWDNSVLPLNIFGQAWLVNDIFLGIVSLLYVWFVFPFLQKASSLIGNVASNRVFACVLALFAVICIVTYA